jgi:hypothetical protein
MKSRLKFVAKEYAEGQLDYDKLNATIQSYYGLMQHFDSYGLRCKIFETIVFKRNEAQGGDLND